MSDDEHFETGVSGSSSTVPVQCSALRKGGHAMLKGAPCKIVEMSTSKTGKHGHAKVHLVGIDIFTGKKYEDICPSTHKMDTPVISKKEYQLLSMDDDFVTLMDENGGIKDDVRVPVDEPKLVEELQSKVGTEEEFMVTVICFDKLEKITAIKLKAK